MTVSTGPGTQMWLETSCLLKLNPGFPNSSLMFCSEPVTRLSRQTTSSPRFKR